MHWLREALSLAIAAALLAPTLDAAPRGPASIGLLVEHIQLEAAAAARVLVGDEPGKAVRALEGRGEAQLVDMSYIETRLGQRARLEAHHEMVYPTDWDPAEQTLVEDPDSGARLKSVPAAPTAFEMRPLGVWTEFDSDFDEVAKGRLSVKVASDLVGLAGRSTYGQGVSEVSVPRFDTRKVQSELVPAGGRRALIGAYTPRAESAAGKTVLVFATVTGFGEAGPDPWKEEEPVDDPFAPDLDPGATLDVAVGMRLVEVDVEVSSELLAKPGEVGPSVERLIDGGEAKILGECRLSTMSGMRSKVEDVHEFIYPTEFNPPGFGPPLPPDAVAFEMRPLGVTLEVDPVVDADSEGVELNFAGELVTFVRMIDYGHGQAMAIQPLLAAAKLATSLRLAPGEERLVAAFTPRAKKDAAPRSGKVVLFLARCDLTPLGELDP